MARREVCFLIGEDDSILWSDASDSPSALPDARARWDAIWNHRERLAEIAHSHPEGGASFSAEDESTMAALLNALGRPLRFSVVSAARSLAREAGRDVVRTEEPWWTSLLRLASGLEHTRRAAAPAAPEDTKKERREWRL